jgi:hypothetical protein
MVSDAMGEKIPDTALRRQLLGTITLAATGGVSPQVDATVDSSLTIGDTPISSIDQEATDADAEVVATGGSIDLNYASIVSSILASFLMIYVLII